MRIRRVFTTLLGVFLSLVILLSSSCLCSALLDSLLKEDDSPHASIVPGAASASNDGAEILDLPPPPPAPKRQPPVTAPPPFQPVKGNIQVGPSVTIGSAEVGQQGGTANLQAPGSPVHGLSLEVPANAYPEQRIFRISYAQITGHTFGADFNPVSPLIAVDNGGGYSALPLKLTIPVKLPAGHFALGFFYDRARQKLEGIPLIGLTEGSVTIATRHFSEVVVSSVPENLLTGTVDSGFRPGIDDWEFTNYGSYIASGGHCAGQSLGAIWYYLQKPDGPSAHLWGRYDNNGRNPTEALWQDDSWGYRFCSTLQADDWSRAWEGLTGLAALGDRFTYNAFRYAMLKTGEPQLVFIWSKAGGGHAMIVYKIEDNVLWIADPNYPSNNYRKIEYVNGILKPYQSGANKEEIDKGNSKDYENINFIANTAVVSWPRIADRWAQLKNGTIGNDLFPASGPQWKDPLGIFHDLVDGMTIPTASITISSKAWDFDSRTYCYVYRDGKELPFDDQGRISLLPGNNLLGIYEVKQKSNKWKYLNFYYVNVVGGGLAIEPAALQGLPDKSYSFTAVMENPPAGSRYTWSVDGTQKQTDAKTTFSASFPSGIHRVTLKLIDTTGKELGNAEAVVTIISATSSQLAVTPPSLNGEINKEYLFTASPPAPAGVTYQWVLDGYNQTRGNEFRFKWAAEGTFTIRVNALDASGKLIASAEAKANLVKPAAAAPNNLSTLQATNRIRGDLSFQVYRDHNDLKAKVHTNENVIQGIHIPWNNDSSTAIPLTWSGGSFGGKWDATVGNSKRLHEISGSVSADGKIITSLKYTYKRDEGSRDVYQWLDDFSITFSNVPLTGTGASISGAATQVNLTNMTYTYTVYDHNALWATDTWTSPVMVANSFIKINFFKSG